MTSAGSCGNGIGNHRPGRTNIREEFHVRRSEVGFDRDLAVREGVDLVMRVVIAVMGSFRGAIGTPEQIRRFLRGYEEAGVDQVIFACQTGRNRHDHVCESLELFASEVMPEFQERDEAHRSRRQERLGSAIEASLLAASRPERRRRTLRSIPSSDAVHGDDHAGGAPRQSRDAQARGAIPAAE